MPKASAEDTTPSVFKKLVNCVNNKSRTTNSEKLSVSLLIERLRAKILISVLRRV